MQSGDSNMLIGVKMTQDNQEKSPGNWGRFRDYRGISIKEKKTQTDSQ